MSGRNTPDHNLKDQHGKISMECGIIILKPNQPKPKSYEGKILVPFSFESALSGVGKSIAQKTKCGTEKNSSYLVNGRVKGFY